MRHGIKRWWRWFDKDNVTHDKTGSEGEPFECKVSIRDPEYRKYWKTSKEDIQDEADTEG